MDRELVGRMLSGDERAFAEFFDGYFPALFRFALARMDRDEDGAEEVVQATLSAAVSKLATYRGEAALFTWLCTFCRHEISAHYRHARRARAAFDRIEDDPEVAATLDSLADAAGGDPETA